MRVRSQLLAFISASAATGLLSAMLVFAAGRRDDAASGAQERAQVAEHEVAGLLALTQEYARYAEPRAAEQWHLRHAAIAAALEGDTSALPGAALVELRNVTRSLPALFTRLEELPANDDPFTRRRKEALLDQLLTNTQAMSDYAYQWFQDSVAVRREAEREFEWVALAVPLVMLVLLVASGLVVRQRVLVPMRRLDRAAAAIRRGDLSFQLASDAQDEFGELSREFDAMTAALLESDRLRDRSEQQLRDITDNLPALVAYIDLEHQYRFANDKYREWLGHDPFSMIGRHVAEVMGEGVYEAMKVHLERALRGERVQWSRTQRRQGRETHLLSEYIPDVDEHGRVRGVYALGVDISERREAELRMARSEQRMVDLTNAIPAMVGYFDMEQQCQYANEAGLRSLGVDRASVPGISMRAALGETLYALHEPSVREVLQGRRARLQGRIPFQGREAHFQAHLIPDRLAGGAQRGYYLMTFDITALKEAESELARVERQMRAITDNLPVSITYIDREERYRFVNRTGLAWMQRSARDVIGARKADVVSPAIYASRRDRLHEALAGRRVEFEAGLTDGEEVRDLQLVYLPDIQPDGTVAGVYGLGTDVTALKKVERQLSLLVRSDVLTGLANRYQFDEALPQALARARRSGAGLALMYLDIDRFKAINDTLGHAAGDEVLKAFAARISQSVRSTDLVARLGGDEFVIILEGLHAQDEPQFVARKIIANATRPLEVAGQPLPLTTSIGIAFLGRVAASDAAAAQALLARADEALYAAKNAGRNTYRVLGDPTAPAEAAAS